MNIGTQTNSLVNHLFSRSTIGQPMPTIGMGATILGWTDRAPATIVKVFTKGVYLYIEVQYDDYKIVSGSTQDGSAAYEYTPNTNAGTQVYRAKFSGGEIGNWSSTFKNDNGRWVSGEGGLMIGSRSRYYDPSF